MSLGTEAAMTGFSAKALVLSAYVLSLLAVTPAHADPFFVKVYGRTYKVDPRPPADQPNSLKPVETMKALPSDIARGPNFRPSHEEDGQGMLWLVAQPEARQVRCIDLKLQGKMLGYGEHVAA